MGAAGVSGCKQNDRCCGQRDFQSAELIHDSEVGGITSWSVLENSPSASVDRFDAEAWSAPARKSESRESASGEDLDGKCDQVLLKYSDSSTYRGQAVDGKRHGQGTWTYPSGEYDGQWKHDLQDGYGRQVWADGRSFAGQFSEGAFHGRGRMEWRATRTGTMYYEGEYVRDVKHGQGRFVWADGRFYDGEWRRGGRSGDGRYVNSKGEMRRGTWKEDKLEMWAENELDPPKGDPPLNAKDDLCLAEAP
mmetsp:Transcript_99126/g.289235  ORF Transcript_99126/g.289235 Transcript_99126/m.289235 type:complete len:249 (-) Transcript_99126:100-846(-)